MLGWFPREADPPSRLRRLGTTQVWSNQPLHSRPSYQSSRESALLPILAACGPDSTSALCRWGRISDRIGRKPVLLIGLGGVTLSLLAFGTSKSLLGMVIARCVGGGLNGNVVSVCSA